QRVRTHTRSIGSRERISAGIVLPGICEIYIVLNDPEEPRRSGTEVLELRRYIIVERSRRSPNRCAPIACHVPCQSEAGRKIQPLNILSGFTDKPGITDKENARRCVLEPLALDPFAHRIGIKIDGSAFPIHDGEERLPTDSIVDCP